MGLENWQAPELRQPNGALSSTIDLPIDARGADWSKKIITNLDLRSARLSRVDLRGADLSSCNLEAADLKLAKYDSQTIWPVDFNYQKSGAIGPGAKLDAMFLSGADLRGMDLRGASCMGAYLSGANLSGAILDGVRLISADLRSAILQGAMCRGTRFTGAQLNQADFRGANLTDAGLDGAETIEGADFSMATGLQPLLAALLARPYKELDSWNPLTRSTTRQSLEWHQVNESSNS
jgi:uncharacterized protein YjbI with pentapeptide repeats